MRLSQKDPQFPDRTVTLGLSIHQSFLSVSFLPKVVMMFRDDVHFLIALLVNQ